MNKIYSKNDGNTNMMLSKKSVNHQRKHHIWEPNKRTGDRNGVNGGYSRIPSNGKSGQYDNSPENTKLIFERVHRYRKKSA